MAVGSRWPTPGVTSRVTHQLIHLRGHMIELYGGENPDVIANTSEIPAYAEEDIFNVNR